MTRRATGNTGLERVWLWYLATASAAVALFGLGAPSGRAPLYLAIHAALAGIIIIIARSGERRSAASRRTAGAVYTLIATPTVFLSLGLVLPAVHPEPWEWTWIHLDRVLLGADPTIALQAWLQPWSTELLQWTYASFYFVPIATIVVLGWRCGTAAFDDALLTVTFCFLLSYLGYFLWPTLPPSRFLPHDAPLRGIWLADDLHRTIDQMELHTFDCFPSGHTMLSLVSVVLAWRVRPLFWILLPIVLLLIFSTVALRYHYLSDVGGGALLAVPGIAIARRLAAGNAT